jgi:methyl-accepting chemotaxis protein
MTSLRSEMSDNPSPLRPSQTPPQGSRGRRYLNSIGSRLFLFVMAGATVGLGITSILFYRTLEQRSTNQVSSILNVQINGIEKELGEVKYFSKGLSNAAEFSKSQGLKTQEAYKALSFNFFLKRPKLAMGAYLIQKPYSLVTDTKWYSPYFYLDYNVPGQVGQKLPAPYSQIIYSELYEDDNYPNQNYYKDPIAAQKDALWMEPYASYGTTITTFYTPVQDSQSKVIAYSGVDVNIGQLTQAIQKTVLDNAGYFALLSEQGKLISYPPDPQKAAKIESYVKVPALQRNWDRIKTQKSGVIRDGGNYWFYQRVPSNNWLLLAVLPESVITGPILGVTLLGTLSAAVILFIVVALFVQRLNRGLNPILEECKKLAVADASTQDALNRQDEIGQLSASFFNLLGQLKQNETTIRQESEMRLALEAEQRRVTETESAMLQDDIEKLLDTVSALEEGNLTIQAPVNDRVTGLVSDTLNRLIEELNRVMSTVSTTAQQVTESATDLEQLATQSSQQAKQQANAVDQIKTLVQNVTQLTQDNTQQSADANIAVQQAQDAVALGQQQMNVLNEEIGTLQEGADQVTRRVQTLTEFVQLATQFVKAQKRTASMTRVLALNASLLSSRATEQQDPEQFASISREFETITSQVNDLATQTNQDLIVLQQRTEQIQTVVSGLSQDIQDINHTVKAFTEGVDGSNQVFDNIQGVTSQVVKVGQKVAESSETIAQASQTTMASVQDIAALAIATEQRADITREQSIAMGKLSRELLELMSFFKTALASEDGKQTLTVEKTQEQASREPNLTPIA